MLPVNEITINKLFNKILLTVLQNFCIDHMKDLLFHRKYSVCKHISENEDQ